jgi:hypothetical protein
MRVGFESGRIWMGVGMIHFKILTQNLIRGTAESCEAKPKISCLSTENQIQDLTNTEQPRWPVRWWSRFLTTELAYLCRNFESNDIWHHVYSLSNSVTMCWWQMWQTVEDKCTALPVTKQAVCVWRNIEARSRNHCYRGKAISLIYSECVCSLSYPACTALCHLRSVRLYNIFSHYLKNGTVFEKKML